MSAVYPMASTPSFSKPLYAHAHAQSGELPKSAYTHTQIQEVTKPSPTAKATDMPSLLRMKDGSWIRPQNDIRGLLLRELDVSRLNKMVGRGLCYAGSSIAEIRPLHAQIVQGRRIVITEQLDLHLLWEDNVIFIKPLPRWLLDDTLFQQYVETNPDLWGVANGFLLSYAFLINHKSDFYIAKSEHLLPEDMEWDDWIELTSSKLVDIQSGIGTHVPCAPRFQFGELHLGRVNKISRYHPIKILRRCGFGDPYSSHIETSFIKRNAVWLTAAFAYIVVVVISLQLGMDTTRFRDNSTFSSVSCIVIAFSILLPLLALLWNGTSSLFAMIFYTTFSTHHMPENRVAFRPPNMV